MIVLFELLAMALLTGSLTAWFIRFMRKWHVSEDTTIMEWIQIHSNDTIHELTYCDFCLNWWLSWFMVLPVVFITCEWVLLITPFFSTTIGVLLSR